MSVRRLFNQRRRFLLLLGALLLFILIDPLLSGSRLLSLASLAAQLAVLVPAIFVVGRSRIVVVTAVVLTIPIVIASTREYTLARGVVPIEWLALAAPFYAFVSVRILMYVLRRERRTTADHISAACCAYLLAAIAFACVYAAVESLSPGSFRLPADLGRESPTARDLVYFSFVTQTTLGYGDITPKGDTAQSLAICQSVCGVLYLAILVARLVGAHRDDPAPDPE